MIFNLIIFLLIAAVTFFHYLQGLFTATISAILAIFAAVLAVSYHEWIIERFLQGRFADYAPAIVMVAMFSVVYFALRVLFDKLVPGYVHVPVLADKVGGAAMGLIAGCFALGVLAIAAQTLPFNASIGGYSRFGLAGDIGPLGINRGQYKQMSEAMMYSPLRQTRLEQMRPDSLWIPVDDLVLGLVRRLSDGGSLAGNRTLASVHPDYLQETFGTRIGIESAAKHTLLNIGALQQARVTGVYSLASVPQKDAELPAVAKAVPLELPSTVKPEPDQLLLVVRTAIDANAADEKGEKLFRTSPSGVRLVANGKNYFPLGTLENAQTLYANRSDDYLLLPTGKGADWVFLVNRADVTAGQAATAISPGVFLEIKRLGRVDLSGKPVAADIQPDANVQVLRKADAPK